MTLKNLNDRFDKIQKQSNKSFIKPRYYIMPSKKYIILFIISLFLITVPLYVLSNNIVNSLLCLSGLAMLFLIRKNVYGVFILVFNILSNAIIFKDNLSYIKELEVYLIFLLISFAIGLILYAKCLIYKKGQTIK